jgi:hypothetical protein
MDDSGIVTIRDARLIFKNFEGRAGQFNQEGARNFCAVLEPELAERMVIDGWNVRYLEPREEGEERTPYLPVAVSFKNRPPRITILTSRARTNLDEGGVEILDWADISKVDIVVRAFEWHANGKGGIKAYLKTLFATLAEDDLEREYAINEVGD